MNFNEYLNKAWQDHGSKTQSVADDFKTGLLLIENSEQIIQLSHLMVHVFGEHLMEWDNGLTHLNLLKENSFNNDKSMLAINRGEAVIQIASNKKVEMDLFTSSDKIQIYTVLTSALSVQNRVDEAILYFNIAIDLAGSDLSKDDPANRSLAVSGNNLACTLEEKIEKSEKEVQLMLLAADTGRKYWEIAGTWLHVERAEYRLAMSYLNAGQNEEALKHANLSLEISEKNKSEALELFFGYEALALVYNKLGKKKNCFDSVKKAELEFLNIDSGDQSWCQETLDNLKKVTEYID